jgi:hypothetical protein
LAEVIRIDRLSRPVLLVSGAVFVAILEGMAVGESPTLTIAAGLVIILAFGLLWRPGQPPALLLVAVIHLLQVTTALFYANLLGVHINTLSAFGVDLEYATLIALGGVFCLIVGMSLGDAGPAIWPPDVAQAEATNWSAPSAFRFFAVTLGISLFSGYLSTLSESTRQLFLAGSAIQWIGVFVLSYVCLLQGRGYAYLLVASGIEVVLGFSGFFGDFRNIFFVLVVAFSSAQRKLKLGQFVAITSTAAVALFLMVFWSATKEDYRAFINKGSKLQVVLVPWEERFDYLSDRFGNIDASTIANGLELLIKRITYVEFLGATMEFVPNARPYEDGKMTMNAILHIFLPRLLVSDKAALPNDTAVTIAYTGLPLMLTAGTSISIGYPGEFYIDFGVFGMMSGMGLLGFFYGKANRYIQRHFSSALIGYGATIPLLLPAMYFETALPKTIGGVCTSFIVLVLMAKAVLPFALNALAWKERKTMGLAN